MKILTYEIELLEPCLVTSLQGDPNSAVAYAYLPGAVLRGAIIDRYIRQQKQHNKKYQFDAAAPESQTLFFNGQTRYLNAYLLVDSQRTFPTPLAWHGLKSPKPDENSNTIYDFVVDDASESQPDREWKPCNFPFTWVQGSEIAYEVEPARHIAIHIARDRQRSRSKDRVPDRDVYRYESLAAGQRFGGAILCPGDDAAATIKQLLTEIIALGGARTGGYGRVAIHNCQNHDQWREIPSNLKSGDGALTLTLLSDTLIRDENGQFAVNANVLTAMLSKQLNSPLTLQRAYYQAAPVGGFNRKWGLPLPQALAFRMGSVFVFSAAPLTAAQLQTLETEGIGERRAEGFGRLAVNGHSEATVTKRDLPELKTIAITLSPESEAGKLAQKLVNRLLRQKLDTLLDEKSNSLGQGLRGMKKSQIYALRQVIQSALRQKPAEGRKRMTDYLNHALKRRVSREQLERIRLVGDNLAEWLQKRVNDETEIWSQNTYLKVEPLPQIGGIRPALTSQMAYEYNLRLADAILARAARVNGQGGGQ